MAPDAPPSHTMTAGSTTTPVDTGSLPETAKAHTRNEVSPDSTFYTWSTFFRLLTGSGSAEEREKYFAARDLAHEDTDCQRCEKHRDQLFERSPVVTFLRQQINTLGPNNDINPTNVRCRRCTTKQQGGFDPNYGILLCANQLTSRSMVEDCMAHEMVHAYDHLRFKVDTADLRHQACTEIRASMLSGECRFTREFFKRGQWKITEQMQECVRRRATLSLMARQGVRDDVHAARIVNSVWDSCFRDTRPFDHIYR